MRIRVGQPMLGLEAPAFLTGTGRYLDDIPDSADLHLAFVRSVAAHADITAIDATAAEALRGVVKVYTSKALSARAITSFHDDPSWQPSAFPPLADGRVRFVGEPIAAIVAEDPFIAEDATELVQVDYEPLPVIADISTALSPDTVPLHVGWTGNCYAELGVQHGNVQTALEQAPNRLSLSLRTNRQLGMTMEPRGVRVEIQNGILTVYTSSQVPQMVRAGLARCLNVDPERLRVATLDVGGGYGVKQQLFPEEVVAAVAALELGRPIRWVEDSREHLLASVHAREQEHELEIGFDHDGIIQAIKARIYTDAGAYSMYPSTAALDAEISMYSLPGPYVIPNLAIEAFAVATNKCPVGPYRGVGRPMACFSIERAMDAIAGHLGLDRLEVRKRNLISPDAFPYETATGAIYDSGDYPREIALVEDARNRFLKLRDQRRSQGACVGVGIAMSIEQASFVTAHRFIARGVPLNFAKETVQVSIEANGKVIALLPTHSHGQGHRSMVAQVLSDELGVDVGDVEAYFGDTALTPNGLGTFNSRSVVVAAGGALMAAREVRKQATALAADFFGVPVEKVEWSSGLFKLSGTRGDSVTLAGLAEWLSGLQSGSHAGEHLSATWEFGAPNEVGTTSSAVHMAMVEVDRATGATQVLDYLVVEDCGRVINPLSVDSQIQGGVAQGIGGALLEELVYDEAGQLRTATLADYLLPTAADVPPVAVLHMETLSPFSANGSKGMAEGGAIAPGAVIASAIEDALDTEHPVFLTELPITPQRLRNALDG